MPVDKDIKKVLIIGSGPIQIGQACLENPMDGGAW